MEKDQLQDIMRSTWAATGCIYFQCLMRGNIMVEEKNKEKPKRTMVVYHKCIVANLISLSTFPNNITMWLALAPPLLLLQGANGFKMF